MQVLKIRKVGTSLGAIFPIELLNQLNVKEGDTLYVTQDDQGGIHITPYDPSFAAAMEAYQEVKRDYRNALKELAK